MHALDGSRAPLKPILKWAGGKRWLIPYVAPLYEEHRHRRLVEPLCGGLAITAALRPTRALANDLNEHTINFYRWVCHGLRIEIPMENNAEVYYAHRAWFNELIAEGETSNRQAAGLFYYLNRTGYNGLCRFNRQGLFNVPFGRYKRINYIREFSSHSAAFRQWTFTGRDFDEIPLEDDDFIYADPPYDVEFTQYSRQGFTWDDQIRLAKWLASHSGPVVVSNQATRRIVELYETLGFELQFLDAPRMISCNGDRTRAREVLGTKGF